MWAVTTNSPTKYPTNQPYQPYQQPYQLPPPRTRAHLSSPEVGRVGVLEECPGAAPRLAPQLNVHTRVAAGAGHQRRLDADVVHRAGCARVLKTGQTEREYKNQTGRMHNKR